MTPEYRAEISAGIAALAALGNDGDFWAFKAETDPVRFLKEVRQRLDDYRRAALDFFKAWDDPEAFEWLNAASVHFTLRGNPYKGPSAEHAIKRLRALCGAPERPRA